MKDYKEYVDMFVKGAKELAEAVSVKTKKQHPPLRSNWKSKRLNRRWTRPIVLWVALCIKSKTVT